MADSSSAPSPASKAKTWLKTVVGALAGICSGAVLMYLTPLIDRVIKPAKPVANFGYMADGLSVSFQNRSSGGVSGWWDFGDGSPLEPVTPEQDLVAHVYNRPGEFTAKLTLRNIINDESERAVIVRLEASRNEPPIIAPLEVFPVSPGSYAPATFQLKSKVQNANLFLWDLGDERPLEVSRDKDTGPVKTAIFDKPGAYVVRLAAVNGDQVEQKSEIIQVNVPPVGTVTAMLSVSDQATRVEKISPIHKFSDAFPPSSRESTYKFTKPAQAEPGFEITDVRIELPGRPPLRLQGKTEMTIDPAALGLRDVRDLRLQLAQDKRTVRLTGELVKDKSQRSPPTLSLPVVVVQEKRTPASRETVPVTATLAVPGSATLTMPPLPADWVEPRRKPRLELREGDRVVWQETELSKSKRVLVQNKQCVITASASGNQIQINLTELSD